MKTRTKVLIGQALRLLATAIEQWDDPDDRPAEPQRLVDEDRVRAEAARDVLRRRGL